MQYSYTTEVIASLISALLPVPGGMDSVTVGNLFLSHVLTEASLWIAGYVFLGIGLFTMAKKRKMKIAPLAFVPFASTFLIGKLVGEINFFGKKIKRLGLYAMLVEIVLFALKVVQDVFYLPILIRYFNSPVTSELFAELYGNAIQGVVGVLNPNAYGIMLEYVIMGVSFISGLAYFILLMFLFRNYSPKSSFLFILLSVFGKVFLGANLLGPIFVFCIRNNSCEEYREFMRMKMHSMYGGGNPYQYDDGRYYDPYQYDNTRAKKEEKHDSPFSEYDDK